MSSGASSQHGSALPPIAWGPAIESEDAIAARSPDRWSIPGLGQALALRWSALAVLLALYAVMSLEPFEWRFPSRVANGAIALADGWSFPTAGIVIADPPFDRLGKAIEAETLDVSLEVRPGATDQTGPARILSISQDAYRRNLTLAQDGDDLVLRLRSADTDRNGTRDGRPVARLADVLAVGEWVAIDLHLRPGRLTIAIDGVPKLSAALPAAVLATWDTSFGVAFGNEMTCDRPWLGDIRNAVIRGPDGETTYAEQSQVELPAACRPMRHPPKLVPLVPLNLRDALRNIAMYLPLGCLLGMMAHRHNRRTFGALVLAVAAVSLAFETAQLFIPSRFPSIDDLIFNSAGGALGVGLGFWLNRRLAAWWPAG
jgi:VanZ family protein